MGSSLEYHSTKAEDGNPNPVGWQSPGRERSWWVVGTRSLHLGSGIPEFHARNPFLLSELLLILT
jgi:hypothetical protein